MADFQPAPLVVIKIGGSLLSLPDFPVRLQVLMGKRADFCPLLIVGGGDYVDYLRELAARFFLDEDFCHRAAIRLMSETAFVLAEILPKGIIVNRDWDAGMQLAMGGIPILNLAEWLQQPEFQTELLPRTWDTTSDSLAALVARSFQAKEFWLLKSADLPEGMSIAEASEAGLVDRSFPLAATGVPQGWWCNLRADQPELRRWW